MLIKVAHMLPWDFADAAYQTDCYQLCDQTRIAVAEHLSVEGHPISPHTVDVGLSYYGPASKTQALIGTTIRPTIVWNPNGHPKDLLMADIDDRLDKIGNQIVRGCPWIDAEVRDRQRLYPMDISYVPVDERRWRTISIGK